MEVICLLEKTSGSVGPVEQKESSWNPGSSWVVQVSFTGQEGPALPGPTGGFPFDIAKCKFFLGKKFLSQISFILGLPSLR